MAIIKKTDPIFGDVSGLLGPVVITKVRSVKVLKIRPRIDRKLRKKKNKGKPKPAQNLKLGLVSAFISKIKKFTIIGFNSPKTDKAAFPSAVQYNIAHAVMGTKPHFAINYPEVVISVGNREMAWSSQISINETNVMTITWEIPDTVKIREIGNDLTYILMYDETKQLALYKDNAIPRSALSYSRPMPSRSFGSIIHAYIFFVSPDGKSRSRSDYVGSVTLPLEQINSPSLPTETQSA